MIVFIPSARGNFDKRAAIRDTWMKNVLQNESTQHKVSVHFAVGRQSCPLPPDDRLSVYSCDEWQVNLPERGEEITAVEEVAFDGESMMHSRVYGTQSLPFTVHHPVVITKLGIYKDSIGTRAAVKLLEASTQKEIVRAVFTNTKEPKGVFINNFWYKSVQPYYLPKGFVGTVVGENLASGNSRVSINRWNISQRTVRNNGSGVLQFSSDDSLPDGHYLDIRRWKSRDIDIVSFAFQVEELNHLKRHVHERAERRTSWLANCSQEDEQLSAELKQHNDIVFIDVVDIYRNVPNKFLHFARWATEQLKFRYLMKTDDDCFVDVERLLVRINELGDIRKSWLGRFRHNWIVEKHGKWAEPNYPALVYPKFACGSGYLLTYDLVHWLANNADDLKTYQGEDVSMGIWLAAVGPTYIDEPLWQCEKECLSDMYVEPELWPDELRSIWTDHQTCGDPCGCS
jgi:beta-1,3-N-acetylgalactosaminyltransferase 2